MQPAERAIFARLGDQLSGMRMLDIGVGGGRTTAHWFPAVEDYLGIDYAATMVAACGQRFAGLPRRPSLAVMDARDLSGLGTAAFDLVLFSFNGIDYVDHGDRLGILREIHRVLKPGGRLVFSSHNLYSLGRTLALRSQLSWNLLKTYENCIMWGLTRLFNRSLSSDRIAAADHLVVRDESHNFRLLTYYVRPEIQLEQLAFGFSRVEVYPWTQTTPLAAAADWSQTPDAWLYYVCVADDAPRSGTHRGC